VKKPYVLLVHGASTRNVFWNIGVKRHHTNKALKYQAGTNTTSFGFGFFPKWLSEDGFSVYLSCYDSHHNKAPNAEECVSCLRKQIIKLAKLSSTKDIIIITQSSGGLVTRAYIDGPLYKKDKKRHGKELVRSVFMIATPNLGVPYKHLMNLIKDFKHNPEVGMHRDTSNRKYMANFNKKYAHENENINYYLIGGNKVGSFLGKLFNAYVSIQWGPNDGMVSAESATTLKGAYQTVVVPEAHESYLGQSYFDARKGKKYSLTYEKYIRPTILGKRKHWGKNMNNKDSRIAVTWTWPFVFIGFTLAYFLLFFLFITRRVVKLLGFSS
jgi:hypothetical protein